MCSENLKEKEEWIEEIKLMKGAYTAFVEPEKVWEG
jgi:hypothetical protein